MLTMLQPRKNPQMPPMSPIKYCSEQYQGSFNEIWKHVYLQLCTKHRAHFPNFKYSRASRTRHERACATQHLRTLKSEERRFKLVVNLLKLIALHVNCDLGIVLHSFLLRITHRLHIHNLYNERIKIVKFALNYLTRNLTSLLATNARIIMRYQVKIK